MSMDKVPTAAGLDLSLTGSGVAFADGRCSLVKAGVAVTTLSVKQQMQVINGLAIEIDLALSRFPLRTVVIEGLDMSQSYGGQIERTWLWGRVVERLIERGVNVYVAPSARVKMYATGSGAAKKGAVVEAVTRRWPRFDTRGDDNMADAATMAMMAAHIQDGGAGALLEPGHPCADLPKSHLRALESSVVRHVSEPPPRKVKK